MHPLPAGGVPRPPHSRRTTEIDNWVEQTKRDLACIEKKGADCNREDNPPILAIGVEYFDSCAKGFVRDCRTRGKCVLLDYNADSTSQLGLDKI